MSGGADVLAVLVPEARTHEGAAAGLLAEAARVAAALGGAATAVEVAVPAGAVTSAEAAPAWEAPADAASPPSDAMSPSDAAPPSDRPPDGGPAARLGVEAALTTLLDLVGSRRPRAVFFLDGDLSREIAPRLAHAFGSAAIVGCTGVSATAGGAVYSKPVYGGWLERELSYAGGALEVATLTAGALSAVPSGSATLSATRLGPGDAEADAAVRRLELRPPDYRTVDLIYAERIVAAGMGAVGPASAPVGAPPTRGPGPSGVLPEEPASDEPLLGHVRRLAELLHASLAATRPVVDDGHLPKERLVGQTGATVAPELYLALGISGSPHHVAGIQDAASILAVDRDAAAPIFQFADAGYVADLREVLPALIRRIEEWRDGGR